MEIVLYILIAGLAAAAGYLGGRWHGAHRYASLKKQLEHETEKFMAMLEERNEDYGRYKANNVDQSREIRRLEVEVDKGEQRLLLQQENTETLNGQLAEQEEKIQKFKAIAEKWSDERAELLGKQGKLEAEAELQQRENAQLQERLRALQERFELVFSEKARIQEQLVNSERDIRQIQLKLKALEDQTETTEFTLSQLRSTKEELATRLAHAEGRLQAYESISDQS